MGQTQPRRRCVSFRHTRRFWRLWPPACLIYALWSMPSSLLIGHLVPRGGTPDGEVSQAASFISFSVPQNYIPLRRYRSFIFSWQRRAAEMTDHGLRSTHYHEGLEVNDQAPGLEYAGLQQEGLQFRQAPPFNTKPQNTQEPRSKEPYEQTSTTRSGRNSNWQRDGAERRNPWGLSPLMFGLLIALTTMIVVGAIVGGGVGGALSSSNHSRYEETPVISGRVLMMFSSSGKDSASNSNQFTTTVTESASPTAAVASPTSTSDVTNYAPVLPQSVATVQWDCPGMTSYTTVNVNPNQQFNVTCGIDFGNHGPANEGGVVADIIGIVAYSAADCMEACANMNGFVPTWGYTTSCAGITFSQQLSVVYGDYGANCWLKNGTAVTPYASSAELSAAVVT